MFVSEINHIHKVGWNDSDKPQRLQPTLIEIFIEHT